MKRLQVGDECYVRDGQTKEIFKCIYGVGVFGEENKTLATKTDYKTAFKIQDKRWMHRIVYPYPIIKQLAK